jgi:hypothetical protein
MEPEKPSRKLLDQMRDVLQTQHYSLRTENVYVEWAKRFILFHDNGYLPYSCANIR